MIERKCFHAMYYTTSGNKKCRPINATTVKDQIICLIISKAGNEDTGRTLVELLSLIDGLPTVAMPDGKKLQKAYYPRVMVVDNCGKDAKPFRVGENSHHELEVRKGDNCSWLSFLNTQCMASTEYANEGYSFVGEKQFEDMEEDTEIVPFDEVWVEEQEGKGHE